MPKLIVTIDGPAAVGKGTGAHLLAQKYKLISIDSGAMYRSAAWLAMTNRVPIDEYHERPILELLQGSSVQFQPNQSDHGPKTKVSVGLTDITAAIRTEQISKIVPIIGEMMSVRELIKRMQRQIATESPNGIVVEGRDTGTVVFPDANIKFFLTATAEVRARRRFNELVGHNDQITYDEVFAELQERDRRDTERPYSALRIPDGAVMVDSTDMTVGQVIERMCQEIEAVRVQKTG